MRRFALAVLALTLAAGLAQAGSKQRVVKLKVGPFPIEAKRDREICQAIRVPDIGGLEVVSAEARSRISNRGDAGSHHLVVYAYNGADVAAFPEELTDDPGCNKTPAGGEGSGVVAEAGGVPYVVDNAGRRFAVSGSRDKPAAN